MYEEPLYSGLELQGTTQAYRECLHHNLAFLFAVVQLLHLTKMMNDTMDIAQASQVSRTATSGYRL